MADGHPKDNITFIMRDINLDPVTLRYTLLTWSQIDPNIYYGVIYKIAYAKNFTKFKFFIVLPFDQIGIG